MKNHTVVVVALQNSPVQPVAMIHVIHLHVSMVVDVYASKIINSIVNVEIKTREFIVNVSQSFEIDDIDQRENFVEVECFPSDATVEVKDVGKVRLSAVKLGDQVQVIDDKNQITYSPIIAFLHRDLNEHATYKRFRTKNARIELSDRHLIHRRGDGFIWAEQLNEGDEILVLSSKHGNQTNYETILNIDDVDKQGLLAPLTEQGTILVNNVHASCYAIVKSHTVGHLALAPYRMYRRLVGGLSDRHMTPILSYANVLFQFFKNLPIVKDLIF